MAKVTLKGNAINTNGELPQVGSQIPAYTLTKNDLSDIKNDNFKGKRVIYNIFPSLDTPTCAASVRRFNEEASKLPNTEVVCVSKDLPFAHTRFCSTEGIQNVTSASGFRDNDFSDKFGVTMVDGPLKGLMARSVVVADENGKVIHTQLVDEIADEPNYENAIASLK